jgi:hypothetical protein
MHNTRNIGLCEVGKFDALCAPSKAKKQEQIYNVQNSMGVCIIASDSSYITQICISEDTVILNWKSGIT